MIECDLIPSRLDSLTWLTLWRLFLFQFASSLLKTASSNIDSTLDEMAGNVDDQDQLVKAVAKGLSNAATRSADAISRQYSKREER
jgi:hypothetical protein